MTVILPTGHWLYQVAMTFYFLSYLTPNILFLRCVLTCASVSLIIWSAVILDIALDTIIWQSVFFCVNLYHAIVIIWKMRPIKFESQTLEDIYSKLFAAPFSAMSRIDFKEFSELSLLRELRKGSTYADVGSKSVNLSILVSGSIEVLNFRDKEEISVGVIQPFDIVDSPQWFIHSQRNAPSVKIERGKDGTNATGTAALAKEEDFRVTLRALEDCVYVMWPIEHVGKFIQSRPYFKSYLDGVIGCDVAKKLFQLDKRVAETDAAVKRTLDSSNNSSNSNNGFDACDDGVGVGDSNRTATNPQQLARHKYEIVVDL